MRSTMLVLLVLVAGTVAPAAGDIEITDLGRIHSFDPGEVEYRLSLNDDRQVAGTCPHVPISPCGFAWEDGSAHYFSVGLLGTSVSQTYDINGSGVIVGAMGTSPQSGKRRRLGAGVWSVGKRRIFLR